MENKGRHPPPHLRRAFPGPGLVNHDPYGTGMRRSQGPFPPVDMLPPPEVMEQKLASQHTEIQRIVTENQRLAATHGTLRQELAAAQHELQMLHGQIGSIKVEREQQMRSLLEKIAKMEAELQSADHDKTELQKAREEATRLVAVRQELISNVQQLNKDLQKAHVDVQQIPAVMSEFDSVRQDYNRCRVTYDYEKKLYEDHMQQLQVMEQNYITMSMEVEKLRAELSNSANTEGRPVAVGPHSGATGNSVGDNHGHAAAQHAHEDSYGAAAQGRVQVPPSTATNAAAAAPQALYMGGHPGAMPARPVYDQPYDPYRGGPIYDPQRGPGYDAYGGQGYAPQARPSYNPPRGPGYDAQGRGQFPQANNSAQYSAPPQPQGRK